MLGTGLAGRGVGGRSRSQRRQGGRSRERHNRGRCPSPDYLGGLGRRASICHAMPPFARQTRTFPFVSRAACNLVQLCGREFYAPPTQPKRAENRAASCSASGPTRSASERLRTLEENGVVERRFYSMSPPGPSTSSPQRVATSARSSVPSSPRYSLFIGAGLLLEKSRGSPAALMQLPPGAA